MDLIKNDVVCILLKCFCNPSVGVEYGGVRVQGMCPHEFYLGTCTCIFFNKIKARGVGVDVEYGGVRVQGMCPHEFYLGTCTCIFFNKIKPRGVGVDVEYGGVRVQGMCPHEFYLGTCTCIFLTKSRQGVWVWMWSMGVSGCKGCVHMNSI